MTSPDSSSLSSTKVHSAGTLRYTTFGIVMLFVWLAWGEFFWVVLDQNLPSILPLKLRELGASDTVNAIFNRSVPYAIFFVFTPLVSMWSDRYRGRLGRRIPFLLWSTPFVGLFLIAIGCYESLTRLATGGAASVEVLGYTLTSNALSIAIIAGMMVGFHFANLFANSIYYYLFNDVVPEKFMSRFMSMFRMVGILSGMLYSKFIFPHVMDYFRQIFMVAGIAYVVGFLVMCVFVKEGEYPPPDEAGVGKPSRWTLFKLFFKQCFSHRFYWYIFLMYMFQYVSFQSNLYAILRNRDSLGLSMDQLGSIGFYAGFISLALLFPAGWLSDRFHPVRVYLYCTLLQFVFILAQCVWVFKDFGPHGNYLLYAAFTFGFLPVSTLLGAAETPLLMKLLPRDKYGQFASANAMVRSLAVILASIVAGIFFDWLEHAFHLGTWRYRFYTVWWAVFTVPMLVCLVLLYREWLRRGGDKGYTPPSI